MLDEAGFLKAKITASNALDAHVVKSLLDEGAPIDNFGIGERLITSSSSPVLSGVYKLAEEKVNGKWIPTIKVSDSRGKVTIPGNKQVYRIYSNDLPNKALPMSLPWLMNPSLHRSRLLTPTLPQLMPVKS